VAMADAGGHGACWQPLLLSSAFFCCLFSHSYFFPGVDEYLENNFQLPNMIMALAIVWRRQRQGQDHDHQQDKDLLPRVVMALVEDGMSILCRHRALAPLHASLLMKLVWYVREDKEGHLRCRWGKVGYCYGRDVNSAPPQWVCTIITSLTYFNRML
jgi:hypothetical protein